MMRIPYISMLYKDIHIVQHFYMLSVLIHSGVYVHEALNVIYNTISHPYLRDEIYAIQDAITHGYALDKAYENSLLLSNKDICASLRVGYMSSKVGRMSLYISESYQKLLSGHIYTITQVIQPLLLVVLGLCIACVIFSLYAPLFSLSSFIDH
jgi:type II secretory pathway component PulF